jgi:hypothetical protein
MSSVISGRCCADTAMQQPSTNAQTASGRIITRIVSQLFFDTNDQSRTKKSGEPRGRRIRRDKLRRVSANVKSVYGEVRS